MAGRLKVGTHRWGCPQRQTTHVVSPIIGSKTGINGTPQKRGGTSFFAALRYGLAAVRAPTRNDWWLRGHEQRNTPRDKQASHKRLTTNGQHDACILSHWILAVYCHYPPITLCEIHLQWLASRELIGIDQRSKCFA